MKKAIVTISMLLIVVTAYAVGLSSKDETKFAMAVKAFRMNQNAEALRLFTELNKDYPQNQQIKNNYAVVLFADGKLEQAEEVLSSVIENNKDVNVAFKNLNKIYDYAAAKAYSNALGSEKEVLPQKLQLIEVLSHQETGQTPDVIAESKAPAIVVAQNSTEQKPVTPEISLPTVIKQPVETSINKQPDSIPPKTSTPTVVKTQENYQQIIDQRLNEWTNVWSKGDVDAYLAFYTTNFTPDNTTTHKQWLENRKARINPSKNIQVKLSDVVITQDNETVIASFKQSYQANQYKDNTAKKIVWKKIGDQWLIEKEITQ